MASTLAPFLPQRHGALVLLLPALFFACIVVDEAAAEGMTSHPYITYLAYEYASQGDQPSITSVDSDLAGKIKKALDENQNTLSMASSFPDYFYLPTWMMGVSSDTNIQPYRDASEAAHWPPFQAKL